MHTLLNRRQVRQYTLEQARSRAHKFSRVGKEFYAKCETHLREFIRNYVHRLPSKGKTIL
jgi:hypothetical protein